MSAAPMPGKPRDIVIVGDGAAGWLAAAALADALGVACRIRVVPVAADPPAGYFGADTLVPAGDARLACLGDEELLLAAARGACGWGVAFAGWSGAGRAWFLPFGSVGANLGPVPFHQLVLRLRSEGRSLRLGDYSLAALAAQAGRFAPPSPDARSVLSTCRPALHLDTRELAAHLRARAQAAGVERTAPFAAAERAADGAIGVLSTADGTRLAADLFVDTSAAAVLAGDDAWEDWSPWLPCDRALVARVPGAAPPPYALAEAHAAGWTRHLPLADATVLVSFFTSGAGGEAAARDSIDRAAGGGTPEIAELALRPGRRARTWHGNCVALGPAAAFVEPLAVGNLHLVQTAVARLLELLPAEEHSPAAVREYNRRTAAELDNARDHAAALYATNGRRGEPFWDERRAVAPPESLAYRLELYASRGKVALYDEEPLEEASWICLLDEQGVRPARHHPMADGFAVRDLEAHLARVRSIMLEVLAKMPSHADYLARARARATPAQPAAREAMP